MKCKLFFLLLFVGVLNASVIKSINFVGLNHLSPLIAQQISGLRVGENLTEQKANTAIINLFNQGYFNNAYIKNINGHVTIVLEEKPIIAKLNVDGVVTNDKKRLDEILGITRGRFYDEYSKSIASDRVKKFYESRGYIDTVSEFKSKDINNGSVEVDVIVNRGENIILKDISLVGAKKIKYSQIEPKVANKKRELMGWMWGFNDGKLKINELPTDPIRIKEEYLRKGYLDANVSTPYIKVYRDNYSADAIYYIQEGKRYKVNNISIDSPEFLNLNTKKIMKKFKLKKNKVANFEWLRRDVMLIKDTVADKGYAFVEVEPIITPDKEKPYTINILYKVNPKDKIYIRNVSISGNDKTADKVIRRELYITEGELYNKTDLSDSLNALKRTGYFEDVNIEHQQVDKDKADLFVKVNETATGSITGGVGYGTADGIIFNIGISEKNLLGSGLTADANIERSEKKLNGSISLTNPRIFDSKYSLGGNIYALDYDWDDYIVKSYGFSLTAGRQIGRYINTYLSYKFEKSRISGIDEYYKKAGYSNGKNTKSSVVSSIVYNDTDDYYIPRSGKILSLSAEYAGLGGTIGYKEFDAGIKWYYGLKDLIDYDLILRYKANATYMLENSGKKLPINEKIFIGGLGSVRGFEARSVPKKQICINDKCKYIDFGGKKSFTNSFELSYPIFDRIKMRGIVFFDYGMVGDNSFSEEKRSSFGAGIEWNTPVGPLQFYWSKPIKTKEYDDENRFDFAIGYKF